MKLKIFSQRFSIAELWNLARIIFKAIRFKKIINLLKLYLYFKLKLTRVNGVPSFLMIEPSSKCNYRCPMCPVVINESERPLGDMELKVYEKVLQEIGDKIIALAFWNYGEPFINRHLIEMIRLAKKKGNITIVSTNYSLVKGSVLEKLVDCGLDYLIVSINGANERSYDRFSGSTGYFESIKTNLKALIELKRKKSSLRPFINLQFIVMKDNVSEVKEINKLAKDLGVDRLTLKEFFYDPRVPDKELLNSIIPKNDRITRDLLKHAQRKRTCIRVWISSVVLWNGIVVPCCGDLHFEWAMGDVHNESFVEAWNGKMYLKFRNNVLHHSSESCVKICPISALDIERYYSVG